MRDWVRTAIRRDCGRCGHVMQPGDPALRLRFAHTPATVLWRCEGCAGPAPENLRPDVPDSPADRPAMFDRIRKLLNAHAPDWKWKQSGERD